MSDAVPNTGTNHGPHNGLAISPTAIEADIIRAVRHLRFGTVVIHVHESRVVQIERSERIRVDAKSARSHPSPLPS